MTKVTIVGAGVIGSAIAYELSLNSQFQITLLDQNSPASGSTSAALGVLMGIISNRGLKLRQKSIKRYQTLIPELEKITNSKIAYNHQGIVKLLFPQDSLEKWHKIRQNRHNQGWQVDIWDKNRLKQELPYLDLFKGNITGAIYSPQDGQVNPTQLTHALIKAAQINGVNCHFGVEIQNIDTSPSNEVKTRQSFKVYTDDAEFDTDWLIITAGLGTTSLTKSLSQPVDIRPVLGQVFHLKLDYPLGNIDFQPVVTSGDIHLVPLENGEYWLGATVEFPDNNGEVFPQEQLLEEVRQQVIRFCPNLAKAKIIKTWSGNRPWPQEQIAPIISKLAGYNNILLATGHYRNGILLAPATALTIKEMLHQL